MAEVRSEMARFGERATVIRLVYDDLTLVLSAVDIQNGEQARVRVQASHPALGTETFTGDGGQSVRRPLAVAFALLPDAEGGVGLPAGVVVAAGFG